MTCRAGIPVIVCDDRTCRLAGVEYEWPCGSGSMFYTDGDGCHHHKGKE